MIFKYTHIFSSILFYKCGFYRNIICEKSSFVNNISNEGNTNHFGTLDVILCNVLNVGRATQWTFANGLGVKLKADPETVGLAILILRQNG